MARAASRQLSPEVRRPQVTFKTVVTVCMGVLLVLAAVVAVTHSVVTVTLTAISLLLAVALDHPVRWLERHSWRRGLAVTVVVLGLLLVLTAFAFLLIPTAVAQAKALIAAAPDLLRKAQGSRWFQVLDQHIHFNKMVTSPERTIADVLMGAATPVLTAVGSVLSFIGSAVATLFATVFMLIFGGQLVGGALDEARPERRSTYASVLEKIRASMGGYLGGLTLVCIINATLTTLFLAFLRVPFFLPLGILSGFSSLIPYVGPAVFGTGISLLAAATGGPWQGVITGIFFVAYGQLEGQILAPLIFRRTVHINPLVTLLSVLFFAELAGIIGAVVAVPAVAVLQIVVREVLKVRREQLKLQRSVAPRSDAVPQPA